MFDFDLDDKGYIKKRESYNLEFKQNFQRDDSFLRYIKTLVGMANNKGGMIVFGVKDSPHIPVGMTNTKFRECDPKDIDKTIREYFSSEIKWKFDIQSFQVKEFGLLEVEEQEEKPVICKKNKSGILREGAIYYRYRGETKEVEYPELVRILEKEREKERILWMQNIERIAMIGPRNAQILDIYKGEIDVGDHKILIDKGIIDKLNFIKEGHFTEKEGEGLPTLKLIGDVQGVDTEMIVMKPDDAYPLTTKDLQNRLGLNNYQIQAVLFAQNVKDKPRHHAAISHGAKVVIHKYSENLVDILQRFLKTPGKLDECLSKYKEYCKTRNTSKKEGKKKKKRKRA